MRLTDSLVSGLCVAGYLATASGTARAQPSFLQLSPGPLARCHEKLDGATGCSNCHAVVGGQKAMLCAECHAHANIKADQETKRGLHGSFTEPCVRCHTEHKGRAATLVDWKPVGGQGGFEHKRTGFPLAGMHEKAPCAACHKKRTASGRTSYQGLTGVCDDCHKNPHQFTKEALRHECKKCHVAGGVVPKNMTAAQVPFDHGEDTGVALVGKHLHVRCNRCHVKGVMAMAADKHRTCTDCHKNKHGTVYRAKPCVDCHDPSRDFKKAIFAGHDKTEFPLAGKHERAPCGKCHKNRDAKPARTCDSCHKDPHRSRFAALACLQCHKSAPLGAMAIDHEAVAKWKLVGTHATTACRSCHRGKKPWEWEKFTTAECVDCHRHKNAHNGQFAGKPCTACHESSGSKTLVFDHNRDSKFTLTGTHAALAKANKCAKCHPDRQYKTGKVGCVDCHKDQHNGQLGAACERCHSPEIKFARLVFDHGKVAAFQLAGLHQQVECKKCHPEHLYKTGRTRCVDCHRMSDPHKGKLGEACDKCHTPDKGATKFVHESSTRFRREGRHLTVACAFCHRARPADEPPPLGWTRTLTAPPPDKTFPVMGTECAGCHRDPHGGRFGTGCQGCHKPTTFRDVSATVHDTGAFRLRGIHASLPCARCHKSSWPLTGQGEVCQRCHQDDDVHRNALGPLCGDCHHQIDWRPAYFSHAQTGFPLKGAHRAARCTGCHGVGTFQGVATECEVCHMQQALRVSDPRHTAELTPCDRCHSELGFVPVRAFHNAFPLIGQHNAVRCTSCHRAGTYLGTPDTCETCHLARYLSPSTQPNHQALGYAMTCEDCHSPVGWTPARAP